ncbi:aldehyde dehydrogenase family protein [Paenibacillus antri]|uniref:Aldehyde dehydrogenase family protein n=1 Tax=Paenibacillus antri TaxID=2582848 RepID=A0A5R9G5J8_9BACL|nr:aldehyde dehydrogenase family protein [Paenibacillus antri]TLS51642.1 aldehyde dehydrogenase family protein [Paenibacillus antri]
METRLNYIDGGWTPPSSGTYADNVNPADVRETVGRVPLSTPEDADAAVRAAHRALPAWRAASGAVRGELLLRAALLLEERAEDVARSITREMGKTLAEARGEALRGAAILKYYASEGLRANGEHIPASDGTSLLFTKRLPLGVVALITPWNFPVAIPIWKMAPALAYGNTVVLKPATNAGLTAARLAELFDEAGCPPGVVNVVHGSGSDIGGALTAHPLVDGVSFTGSNAVGARIARIASERGAKYQLEMGGKNAVVVWGDAELERAADLVVSGAMKSAGQKCTATSKVIVAASAKERFAQLLLERIRAIRVGDGMDPNTYFGPVATPAQRDAVLQAIRRGAEEGARLLHGGGAPDRPELQAGCYVEPTLFDRVTPETSLAREEIFGPVLALMEATDLDEAIALANGTEYGLSAAIFTGSLKTAMTFANRVEAGMIKVNGETAGVEYQAPFGGLKKSSSHSREQGRAAMEFFTHTQTISISV